MEQRHAPLISIVRAPIGRAKILMLKIGAIAYWLSFTIVAYIDSRKPGYYPPAAMKIARELAKSQPVPWTDVIWASLIFAVVVVAIYLMIRFDRHRFLHIFLFSIFLFFVAVVVSPHAGGVYYTGLKFATLTLLIPLLIFLSDIVRGKYRK